MCYVKLGIQISPATSELCPPLGQLCSEVSTPRVVMQGELNSKPHFVRNPSAKTNALSQELQLKS